MESKVKVSRVLKAIELKFLISTLYTETAIDEFFWRSYGGH
jgi:hypothetical protein